MVLGAAILAAALAFKVIEGSYGSKTKIGLLVFTLLAASSIFPKVITLAPPNTTHHGGLSHASLSFDTYTVAAFVFLLSVTSGSAMRYLALCTPFLVFLAIGTNDLWGNYPTLAPGIIHLCAGIAALAAGLATSHRLLHQEETVRWLILGSASIIGIHFIASLGQLAGFDINPTSVGTAVHKANTIHGLSNHPNNLGKSLILVLALMLPAAEASAKKWVKTTTLMCALCTVAMIGLTGARANFVAVFVLVVAWYTLASSIRLSYKYGILLTIAAPVALTLNSIIARFNVDPSGGSRPHMTQLALAHIAEKPLFGVGPNNYVAVAGVADGYTRQGIPVHNSFLLLIADIGIVGVALLLLPIVWSLFKALSAAHNHTSKGAIDNGAHSFTSRSLPTKALACLLPGLIVIGATGYGLVSGSMFIHTMFVLGVLTGARKIHNTLWERPAPPSNFEKSMASVKEPTLVASAPSQVSENQIGVRPVW